MFQMEEDGTVNLKPTMVTTPLTFATHDGQDKVEEGKGIKLLTVTYTVGLKYNKVTPVEITLGTTAEEIDPDTYNSHDEDHTKK